MTKWDLILKCKNGSAHAYQSVTYATSTKSLAISADAKKAFDEIQYPLVVKTFKLGIEETDFNTINIKSPQFSLFKNRPFSTKSITKPVCLPTFTTSLSALEVLVRAIRQEIEIMDIHIRKKEVNLSLTLFTC